MGVRWLRGALRNLDHAVAYIAEDNPVAAARVAGEIERTALRLQRYPQLGRPGRLEGTRELPVSRTYLEIIEF
jgi:toxin ParE1/3/4